MSPKLLKFITLAILLVLLNHVKGFCFNVTAQVDRNTISINDSIVLSVVFEDGEGSVDITAITDFTIVSQSSSSNISIINGRYSKSITQIYTIIPKKTGSLKIPELKVEHENKIYTTKEIIVEVVNQSAAHNNKDSKDIFIESGISASSLFTGQQAVYQLRFYSAVKLSNASLQPPSFKGFTAKEAGKRNSYQETINGRLYYVTEINYIIIPETAGDIEIDRAVIICDVPVKRGSRNGLDPFDDPFFSNNGFFSFGRTETRQFAADTIVVHVEPMPPYSVNSLQAHSSQANSSASLLNLNNIPFSGLVGDFSINAALDNKNLKIGDSGTLTITIAGKGNIMDAKAPSVLVPPEFKVYDDSPEEKIELTFEGYSGKKIFKKAIVPIKSGKYIIEPVGLSFFNVSTRKYQVISTNQIIVQVEDSADQQQINVNNAPNSSNSTIQNGNNTEAAMNSSNNKMVVKKKKVEFTGKDILSIKEDASVLVDKKELSFTIFLSLIFLPCVLFFAFMLVIISLKKEINISEAMIKKAKMSLKSASESLNKEDFFKSVHDALIAMVISKGDLKQKSINTFTDTSLSGARGGYKAKLTAATIPAITSNEAAEILTDSGFDSKVIMEVTEILGEIESARYGRQEKNSDYCDKMLQRVKKLFQTFAVAAILFISTFIFTIFSLYPEKIYADQADISKSDTSKSGSLKLETLFVEGIKAYHSGNFKEAAEKFSAIRVENPYLYYNIGNAYIKAGDVGRAVLWYERAKIKIPLDPDLKFNLDYAKDFVTDKVDGSSLKENIESNDSKEEENLTDIDILEVLFFWKDYFLPQNIQYGAIILSFIFFLYAGIRYFYKKRIFTSAGLIIFLVFITTFFTSIYSYYSYYVIHFAVVLSKEAPVRSGNSQDATKLFILHAGTKVKVEEIKGSYIKIIFSKDKIGWISLNDAEII